MKILVYGINYAPELTGIGKPLEGALANTGQATASTIFSIRFKSIVILS